MIDFNIKKKKEDVSIDITPLVDILLQLLIFFVLSTTFIQNYNGIDIALPHSSLPHVDTQKKYIVVFVNKNGDYYLDNERCSIDKIISLSKKTFGHSRWIMIKADKETPYKFVIKLIDALHKGGLTRFWLVTLPENSHE